MSLYYFCERWVDVNFAQTRKSTCSRSGQTINSVTYLFHRKLILSTPGSLLHDLVRTITQFTVLYLYIRYLYGSFYSYGFTASYSPCLLICIQRTFQLSLPHRFIYVRVPILHDSSLPACSWLPFPLSVCRPNEPPPETEPGTKRRARGLRLLATVHQEAIISSTRLKNTDDSYCCPQFKFLIVNSTKTVTAHKFLYKFVYRSRFHA